MSNAPEREANGMTCEGKPWIKHYGEAHPDPDERGLLTPAASPYCCSSERRSEYPGRTSDMRSKHARESDLRARIGRENSALTAKLSASSARRILHAAFGCSQLAIA